MRPACHRLCMEQCELHASRRRAQQSLARFVDFAVFADVRRAARVKAVEQRAADTLWVARDHRRRAGAVARRI